MTAPLNPTLEQKLDETLETLDILGCSLGAINLIRKAIKSGRYPTTLTQDIADSTIYNLNAASKGLDQVCDSLTKYLVLHGASHGSDITPKGQG